MPSRVRLADAMRALRAELLAGVQEGYYEDVRFALGTVQFDAEVQIEADASGGIQFWVSGDEERSPRSTATHRVRVNLSPTLAGETPGGVPLVVGAERIERPE